jgi:Recombination endonuclease VII
MATPKSITSYSVHPSCRRGRNIYRSCWPCLARAIAQWGYDVEGYARAARRQYVRECRRRSSPSPSTRNWKRNRFYRYGLTPKTYAVMLQAQQGVCLLCRQPEIRRQHGELIGLAIDHDHTTGKVRGLLCARCNQLLGSLEKHGPSWVVAAFDYLRHSGSLDVSLTIVPSFTPTPAPWRPPVQLVLPWAL